MRKGRLKGAARVVEHVGEDPTRGDVFWFLFREHDAILERAQGKRISWLTLLADIRALGLKNADGKLLDSVDTLKSTFRRVCLFKRREAEAKQQRAAERRRPTNDPPPVVARTVAPTPAPAPVPAPTHQPPSGSVPFQIKIVPREVIEEEARQAYERRPDLFPHGPDILRYKILKESGKRL
jgi:hypothetical protein